MIRTDDKFSGIISQEDKCRHCGKTHAWKMIDVQMGLMDDSVTIRVKCMRCKAVYERVLDDKNHYQSERRIG